MHRPLLIHTLGRLAAAIGILASLLLLLGTGRASAEEHEAPYVTEAFSNAPRVITLAWIHQGEGVYGFAIQIKEGDEWLDVRQLDHTFAQFTLTGLEPETWYALRVCAVYDPDGSDRECSEPELSVQTRPLPGQPANFDPPTIIDFEVTPDAIKVIWGPTGDYTRILVHLSDALGNVDQREVQNVPNGSYTFPGLRAGALYRVILKGCSFSLNNGCGDWSPDVFITTPLPPQEPPPPSKPTLTLAGQTATTVSLEFSVKTQLVTDSQRFLVFRDGVQIQEVMPRAAANGFVGSYTDTVQTFVRHRYHVCFKQYAEQVCSDSVSPTPAVEVVERVPVRTCHLLPEGCDAASPDLPYGPDTCKQGYVWREAFDGDTVCVTPATRTQAAADNAQAAARREPSGGAYGPETCRSGYVWRVARAEDLVCVTPETRDQTAADNAQANQRRVVPR